MLKKLIAWLTRKKPEWKPGVSLSKMREGLKDPDLYAGIRDEDKLPRFRKFKKP